MFPVVRSFIRWESRPSAGPSGKLGTNFALRARLFRILSQLFVTPVHLWVIGQGSIWRKTRNSWKPVSTQCWRLRWSCWTRRWSQTRYCYRRMTPKTARRTKPWCVSEWVAGLCLRGIFEACWFFCVLSLNFCNNVLCLLLPWATRWVLLRLLASWIGALVVSCSVILLDVCFLSDSSWYSVRTLYFRYE